MRVTGMSYQILKKIYDEFGDWGYAWLQASVSEIKSCGIHDEMAEIIVQKRKLIDVNREIDTLWQKDIFLVERENSEYPKLLKKISDAPFLLYRKGARLDSLPSGVAVVGTRTPSAYGERMSYEIGEKLGFLGLTVVSGLAFGADASAHLAAVQNGYPTVAVLASGIEKITPSSHTSLARMILEKGGAIVSEYPPSMQAMKHHFLWRNRIISGLSKATIVVEAQKRSGALSTAEHALKQQRKVFALVGDIDRAQVQGCLQLLLNKKAEPLYDLGQLENWGENSGEKKLHITGVMECEILLSLSRKRTSAEIAERIEKESSMVAVQLSLLEIQGMVERDIIGNYKLTVLGKKLRLEALRARALAAKENCF